MSFRCFLQKEYILLFHYINVAKGHLEDSKQLTRDISTVGHFGNGDYELKISDTKYLEYIMSLVKQAIK